MNPFDSLDSTKYPDGFKQFLYDTVRYSIRESDNNGGKYICSWVVNKANPAENRDFKWKGEMLVKDAVHDAGRASSDWRSGVIDPLIKIWGVTADVDFEQVKQDFLEDKKVEVNSMIIPSTLDQGDVISPFLPINCIHTFDNGAKKATQFGYQYVTQATIYDTGYPVDMRSDNNIKIFPPNANDYENFGTLTITTMPIERRTHVFVIFSHGRFITQTKVGMEGFMIFFDADDFIGVIGGELPNKRKTQEPPLTKTPNKRKNLGNSLATPQKKRKKTGNNWEVSYFNETSLKSNIRPVSNGEYLNGSTLQSSTDSYVMPDYFAEIIKFIADRNQCIMSGFFSNLKNADDIPRFYGETGANKLMLVSGDRYILEDVYLFMDSNIYIPFAYFGQSRYEKYFEKDGVHFNIVSSPTRCLFSVRHKEATIKETESMRQFRELTNLIESATKLNATFEISIQTANMKLVELEKKMEKATAEIRKQYVDVTKRVAELKNNKTLMDTMKQRIEKNLVERLNMIYEAQKTRNAHEDQEMDYINSIKTNRAMIEQNEKLIKKYKEELDKMQKQPAMEDNNLANSELTEEVTSIAEVSKDGFGFNNTTRIVKTVEGIRLQDVESGYIYEPDEAIFTIDESIQRANELRNTKEFAKKQHKGGTKRTAKCCPSSGLFSEWMVFRFSTTHRRMANKTRRNRK